NLAPPNQRDPESPRSVDLTFPKALRRLMSTPILTRTEERVLTTRAMSLVASDPAEQQMLRHDRSAWTEALADLDARGYDLTDPDTAATLTGSWANPALGGVLAKFQEARRDPTLLQDARNRRGFEAEARVWLQ